MIKQRQLHMSDEKKQSKFCESFQESQKLFNQFQNLAENICVADGKLVGKIKALNDSFTVFNQNVKDVKDGSVVLKSSLCDQLETVKKHLQTILDDVHETKLDQKIIDLKNKYEKRKEKAEKLLSLIKQLQKVKTNIDDGIEEIIGLLRIWIDKKKFFENKDFKISNKFIDTDETGTIRKISIFTYDDICVFKDYGYDIFITCTDCIFFDFDK